MIISIFPSKDATIGNAAVSESVNTGIDEILEVTKVVSESGTTGISNTRTLIKFDLDWISQSLNTDNYRISESIAKSAIPRQSSQFYLNLYATKEENIPAEYHLAISPVSESWEMGLGRSSNVPYTKEGVSWKYRDGETPASRWNANGVGYLAITGSWLDDNEQGQTNTVFAVGLDAYVEGPLTGSTFYSGSFVTKSYQDSADLSVNVSKSVSKWFEASTTQVYNEGFLVSRIPDEESNGATYGSLQYFSNETKTIYRPRLEVRFADWTWSSTNVTEYHPTGSDLFVYLKNNIGSYKTGSMVRLDFGVRKKYPIKTYGTASQADVPTSFKGDTHVLTTYCIKDYKTKEVVVPHDDDFTKMSCDDDGMYTYVWFQGLYPERLYYFELRAKDITNDTFSYDYEINEPFKVLS